MIKSPGKYGTNIRLGRTKPGINPKYSVTLKIMGGIPARLEVFLAMYNDTL